MAENSKIEWTHHTFNPWIGCTKVSDGCKNCYAEALMDKRMGKAQWGDAGTRVRTSESNWKLPLKWNREAAAQGIRYRVFCSSLADVFEDRPELEPWRVELFGLIKATPNIDWLLLTKRPENIMSAIEMAVNGQVFDDEELMEWVIDWLNGKPPHNVWIGTSVENQEQADKRIPELLEVPAKVRFLSCEPLLGPVNLRPISVSNQDGHYQYWPLSGHLMCDGMNESIRFNNADTIHWVIAGGESGPGARPMHPDWTRSLRDQCQAAGVPFFFKQWGEFGPVHGPPYNVLKIGHGPKSEVVGMAKIGKHAAGRELDGQIHNEFHQVNL